LYLSRTALLFYFFPPPPPPPPPTLFPYTTLFRSNTGKCSFTVTVRDTEPPGIACPANITVNAAPGLCMGNVTFAVTATDNCAVTDRKSTRLNSSHVSISYAVFCLKKKNSDKYADN